MDQIKSFLQNLRSEKRKRIGAALLLILLTGVAACILYHTHLLNLINRPDPAETTQAVETLPEEPTQPPTTSPEETWPEIISDQNITNIMLVGQAAREGESARIADTMILCSINRETRTLTMTSIMRDLRLVWPEFRDANGKLHYGHNRINMAYNMGYKWAGNPQGGMELLASIVEHNLGVPVDHTVEINFDVFQQVMDVMGGVDVELSEAEVNYLQDNYPASDTAKTLEPGVNHLSPYLTLAYARMRKVGNGDYERTERQRRVITLLIDRLREMNILEVLDLSERVLPMITTDMTNREITNYAFEFIPMLKELNVQSQSIPFPDTYWPVSVDMGTYIDSQIDCDAAANGKLLRQSIGMEETVRAE